MGYFTGNMVRNAVLCILLAKRITSDIFQTLDKVRDRPSVKPALFSMSQSFLYFYKSPRIVVPSIPRVGTVSSYS
jgi:hypothetical protein